MTDSMILHLEDLEKRYFSYFFNTLILPGDIYDKLYCCRIRWFHWGNTSLPYRTNPCLRNYPVSRQNIFYQYRRLHCYRSCCHACLKRIYFKSKACSFLKDWHLRGIYYILNLCTWIYHPHKRRTSKGSFSLYDTQLTCRSMYDFCNGVSFRVRLFHIWYN